MTTGDGDTDIQSAFRFGKIVNAIASVHVIPLHDQCPDLKRKNAIVSVHVILLYDQCPGSVKE